jgi:hypothetical protein
MTGHYGYSFVPCHGVRRPGARKEGSRPVPGEEKLTGQRFKK